MHVNAPHRRTKNGITGWHHGIMGLLFSLNTYCQTPLEVTWRVPQLLSGAAGPLTKSFPAIIFEAEK